MGFIVSAIRLFATFLLVTIAWSLARRVFSAATRGPQRTAGPPPPPRPQPPDPHRSPRLDPSIEDAEYEELP